MEFGMDEGVVNAWMQMGSHAAICTVYATYSRNKIIAGNDNTIQHT